MVPPLPVYIPPSVERTVVKMEYVHHRFEGAAFVSLLMASLFAFPIPFIDGMEGPEGILPGDAYDPPDIAVLSGALSKIGPSVPQTPRSLTVLSGDNMAILTWLRPVGSDGSDITGYLIQRSIDGREWGNLTLVDRNITGFQDNWISNGMVVKYRVVAVGGSGWSSPSNEVTAVPLGVPWAPIGLHFTMEGTKVVMEWDRPLYTGGAPINGYIIFRRTDIDRSFIEIARLNSTETSWTDRGIAGNSTVRYYIVASNKVGDGVPSETITVFDVPSGDLFTSDKADMGFLLYLAGAVAMLAIAGITTIVWRSVKPLPSAVRMNMYAIPQPYAVQCGTEDRACRSG